MIYKNSLTTSIYFVYKSAHTFIFLKYKSQDDILNELRVYNKQYASQMKNNCPLPDVLITI